MTPNRMKSHSLFNLSSLRPSQQVNTHSSLVETSDKVGFLPGNRLASSLEQFLEFGHRHAAVVGS